MVKYYESDTGFLYFARDENGDLIFDLDGNIQVNLLVTNKNGFVRVKPKVGYWSNGEFIGYESSSVYWTDNQRYIVNGYIKGKPKAELNGRYLFTKNGYYICVKEVFISAGNYRADILVYDSNYNNLGGFSITDINGINFVQANKSATELLLVISFDNSVIHATGFNINNGWQKILKFSISEVEASPFFDFVLTSERVQCTFLTIHHKVNSTVSSNDTDITQPPFDYAYKFSLSESYTVTSTGVYYGIDNTNKIVLQCYYDNNDVYQEDIFEFVSVTNDFSHSIVYADCFLYKQFGLSYISSNINTTPPQSGGTITTNTAESHYEIQYKVNDVLCNFRHKTADTLSVVNSSFNFVADFLNVRVRLLIGYLSFQNPLQIHEFGQAQCNYDYTAFNRLELSRAYYSKLDTYFTSEYTALNTNINTVENDPTGILQASSNQFLFYNYDWNAVNLPDYTVISGLTWVLRINDYATATYRVNNFCIGSEGIVFTDKFTNHLVCNGSNIRFSDKNALTFINLEPDILGSSFYQSTDFIGAI